MKTIITVELQDSRISCQLCIENVSQAICTLRLGIYGKFALCDKYFTMLELQVKAARFLISDKK